MTKRPDFTVLLMAGFSVGTATILGVVAERSGLAADITMILANASFIVCCYVTTLAFEDLLYLPSLDALLVTFAKKKIDIMDLFHDRMPASSVLGEKIWGHKPVSQCVLIKIYASDTQALYDKIVSQLLASIFAVLIISAGASLVGRVSTPISAATPAAGIAISLINLVVTFAFAVIRVYWPLFELAQRNRSLVRDAESHATAG